MTKLVVVLAVVIVVILVIVIIAARSMRAEDPEEFAGRPGRRGLSRGDRDGRTVSYQRREYQPGRGGRGERPARPSQRPGGSPRSAGASAGRGPRDQPRSRGYDRRAPDGRDYESDRGPDSRGGRGYDGHRTAGPRSEERRRDGRPQRRPEEHQPDRARPARSRRPADSSEWDSSEWDKLSDVDYWAELASDKPLTTTAQPAAQPAAKARSGYDGDTDALPGRSSGATAAPRRDPATGLPVRDHPQPADLGLAAAAGRADFTPAPVPASAALDGAHPIAAAPAQPRVSRHAADPASMPTLPGAGRGSPQRRPPVDPDDDPLTSPSFPRIPADDSRSYRSGRAHTPPGGSSTPSYLAPTQQFASYGSPTPEFNGRGSTDATVAGANGYPPDPLLGRDGYSAPARPVSPAPATGNPYGSYVTPVSQAAVPRYGEYPGEHSGEYRGTHSGVPGNGSNGHGTYLPPARPGEASQPAGDGYWPQPSPAPPVFPTHALSVTSTAPAAPASFPIRSRRAASVPTATTVTGPTIPGPTSPAAIPPYRTTRPGTLP